MDQSFDSVKDKSYVLIHDLARSSGFLQL
jgi:hypothetical protein